MAEKTKAEVSDSVIVETEYYYDIAFELFKDVKKFKHTVDTYRNTFIIKENAFKVEKDFNGTYGGNKDRLLHAHYVLYGKCSKKIEIFNEACRDCGVEEIHDPDNFLKNFLVNGRITAVKKIMKKHMKEYEILSMQDFFNELGSQK